MATTSQNGNFAFRRDGVQTLLPDPTMLAAIFLRRLWLFVGVVCFVMSAVVAAVVLAPRSWQASSSVLIEPRKEDPTGTAAVVPGLPADTNVVDTQVRIIGGPTVGLMTVRELHLASNPDYAENSKPVDTHLAREDASPAEIRALTRLLRDVNVRRSGLTYVIDIDARAATPDLAAAIANSLARNYIALGNATKRTDTTEAARFVQDNANALREQALRDDQALQSYMIAHNLMSADGATLAEHQIADLGGQIAQARATLAQEQGRYNAARAQIDHGGGADVNAVLSSETIRQLRQQEAMASAQLASLQARYGDLHPDVISARDNLADIRRHISEERDRILSGLKANVQVAQNGLVSLQASYDRTRGALADNNSAMVGLQDLQHKADASKAVYSAFLQRAKETAAQTQAPTADASLSAEARLPERPIWPNYPLALVFGGLGATVAGLLAIGLAEYLDRSVHSREEMENLVGVRYAGAVPDLRKTIKAAGHNPEAYLLSRPYSLFAEAMRNLGAFVSLRSPQQARVIAITSSLPREGKTTLAICLARTLARAGRRVVIVDGDFRRHSATNILAPDLVLDEHTPAPVQGWRERLVKDADSDLYMLPAQGAAETATQMTLDDVTRLYEELKAHFELVIVDTAPVLGLAETRLLARAADAVLLAVRWRSTSSRASLSAATMLRECNAHVAGGVLTMVDARKYASTGQADSYAYHKRFTKYYVN